MVGPLVELFLRLPLPHGRKFHWSLDAGGTTLDLNIKVERTLANVAWKTNLQCATTRLLSYVNIKKGENEASQFGAFTLCHMGDFIDI